MQPKLMSDSCVWGGNGYCDKVGGWWWKISLKKFRQKYDKVSNILGFLSSKKNNVNVKLCQLHTARSPEGKFLIFQKPGKWFLFRATSEGSYFLGSHTWIFSLSAQGGLILAVVLFFAGVLFLGWFRGGSAFRPHKSKVADNSQNLSKMAKDV